MMKAVQDKNLAAFRKESALFLEMGRDIDTLMATRHELLLGAWIADARKWGLSSTEQAFYEHNARQILSTWREPGNEHNGGTLTDYASRQWNGMMKSYYMPRWEEYIKRQDESLVQSKPFNQSAYAQWRIKFEADWVDQSGENFLTKPEGDACETAKRLFEKYRKELMPLSVSPSVPH
jgi:alpha-N-acetylglucosaminidase